VILGWFLPPAPDGVHEGEFDERAEDESSADDEPYLRGFNVGDFGQGAAGVTSEGDERQHGAGSCSQNGHRYSEATRDIRHAERADILGISSKGFIRKRDCVGN